MPLGEDKSLEMPCQRGRSYIEVVSENCLGVPAKKLLEELEVICLKKDGVLDVYTASHGVTDLIQTPQLVFAGIHVARTGRHRAIPLLGLLSLMHLKKLRPRRGYVVAGPRGEQLFLYGRDLLAESIRELREPGSGCTPRGLVAVLNSSWEPLGWGRLRRSHNTIYVQNLVDAGWYLRSGV